MVKLILHKVDLQWLQKNGFIGQEQVAILWEQLTQKCPNLPSEGENNEQQTTVQLDLPSVAGNYLGEHPRTDICIAYSLKNGEKLASRILDGISKQSAKTAVLAYSSDAPFDAELIEKNVATSACLVVLLTQDCLKQVEVVYSMLVAKFYYQHPSLVILVHDAESCAFPGYDEQPPSVKDFFSEKAITFLGCYPEEGIEEILAKFDTEMHVLDNILKNFRQKPADALLQFLTKNEHRKEFPVKEIAQRMRDFMTPDQLSEFVDSADSNKDGTIDQFELPELITLLKQKTAHKAQDGHQEVVEEAEHEDITTRVFLSHKRSTGQGIAGRFYEGLKIDYRVFIDSEAKFKIHNLKTIVQNTDAFVFLLTYGIMLSKWCLEELKAAIAFKKRVCHNTYTNNIEQIIIVRELSYVLPDVLPPEWQEVESVLRTSPELVWLAEYNSACVKALKRFIGSADDHWKPTSKIAQTPQLQDTIKEIIEKAKDTGIFDFNVEIPLPNSNEIFADAMLDFVLRQVPIKSIKGIRIGPFETTNVEVLKYLITQLPQLEEVEIDDDDVDNNVLKNISHRLIGLSRLRLTNARITDEAINFLVKHNPRLVELQLIDCGSLSDGALDLAVQLPHLQKLVINNSIPRLNQAKLAKLVSTGLQHLELSHCEVGDDHIALFHGASTLKELRLIALPGVSDVAIEGLLKTLPNLRTLQVSHSNNVNDKVVRAITGTLCNLISLDISCNPNLNTASVVSIVSSCHQLQELCLTGLSVDDNTIKAIAEGCPGMKKLDVRLSFSLTSEPLTHLKELKELRVSANFLPADLPQLLQGVDIVSSTDAYDASRSYYYFYPAIALDRRPGEVLVHYYGVGAESWVPEDTLLKFSSRADSYGPMSLDHTYTSCSTCACLHSLCRNVNFDGGLNWFFINEDFEKWKDGVSMADSIARNIESSGEFTGVSRFRSYPSLKFETVLNYVVKKIGDINKVTTLQLSELSELQLVKHFPNIKGVTCNVSLLDYENWATRLKEVISNLTILNITGDVRPEKIPEIFEKFPQLEKLQLSGSLNDGDLEHLPRLTNLKDLDISRTLITQATLKNIGQMTQLRRLTVDGVAAVNDETIALLFPLGDLECLSIRSTGITAKGMEAMKDQLLKLTELRADMKLQFDAAVVKIVVENHPALSNKWNLEGGDLSKVADILDTVNKWYPAYVMEETDKAVRIHYYGWNAQYDEWIDKSSPRYAKPLTHAHEYGKQGGSHFRDNTCKFCPELHGICKDILFGGAQNVYFSGAQ